MSFAVWAAVRMCGFFCVSLGAMVTVIVMVSCCVLGVWWSLFAFVTRCFHLVAAVCLVPLFAIVNVTLCCHCVASVCLVPLFAIVDVTHCFHVVGGVCLVSLFAIVD